MTALPNNPVVYQINAAIWLRELSAQAGRSISLGSIPDAELQALAERGFDALWLMGVWQKSHAARNIALQHPAWLSANSAALPDWTAADIVGSPFAIYSYAVDTAFGGDAALATLRQRLARLNLRLILDFVPNHLAIDHEWTSTHPEYLVQGTLENLSHTPQNYFAASNVAGEPPRVFAHGRDPYFDGWPDTVQIDFRRSEVRRQLTSMLLAVAGRCDGLRCDMAMLITRAVFLRTWGGTFDGSEEEFWPAAISQVKSRYPGFAMIAEVYWDMEPQLQAMGFDFTYDKGLYDRLLFADGASIQNHLTMSSVDQRRQVRFIENHDEQRAVAAFGGERSRAVAALALGLPGMRLLHDGQMEGRRVKLPVQLARRPEQPADPDLQAFYQRLLMALTSPVFDEGEWRLLSANTAWAGNFSHASFVAYRWALGQDRRLLTVNLAPHAAQCYVPLDLPDLAGRAWRLEDMLSGISYLRHGDELLTPGLYLDLQPHGHHLFNLQPA